MCYRKSILSKSIPPTSPPRAPQAPHKPPTRVPTSPPHKPSHKGPRNTLSITYSMYVNTKRSRRQ